MWPTHTKLTPLMEYCFHLFHCCRTERPSDTGKMQHLTAEEEGNRTTDKDNVSQPKNPAHRLKAPIPREPRTTSEGCFLFEKSTIDSATPLAPPSAGKMCPCTRASGTCKAPKCNVGPKRPMDLSFREGNWESYDLHISGLEHLGNSKCSGCEGILEHVPRCVSVVYQVQHKPYPGRRDHSFQPQPVWEWGKASV